MPFTVSHAIVAVPFVRTRIPPAAVAIGAMVPDVGLYAPIPGARELTHAPLGVVSVDLALGVAGLLLWVFLLRAPARDLAPRVVRARLGPPRPTPVLWSVLGLVIGSATHLLWDAFSHDDGAAVLAIPALQQMQGPFLGFKWVQYVSGVLGLALLVLCAVIWLLRTPAHPAARGGSLRRSVAIVAVVGGALAPAAAILVGRPEHPFAEDYRGFVVEAAIVAVTGAAISVFAVAVLWQIGRLIVTRTSAPHPLG